MGTLLKISSRQGGEALLAACGFGHALHAKLRLQFRLVRCGGAFNFVQLLGVAPQNFPLH
jgi:hypothetical protein